MPAGASARSMAAVDFAAIQALTFDCYGTLIDWERGILAALRPLVGQYGVQLDDDGILERYARLESALEAGPYRPYRQILAEVVRGLGAELGFAPSEAEAASLADSLGSWPPFPDTVEALRRLSARFQLGIISNTDDDLFAQTAQRLAVTFTWVTTAQQAHAYKPSLAPFELALGRLAAAGVERTSVVHVAQSLFHDHVPAQQLGLASVWVNRRHGRSGGGATPLTTARAQLEVPSLGALAELALRS